MIRRGSSVALRHTPNNHKSHKLFAKMLQGLTERQFAMTFDPSTFQP
jgi:hypothetical protein